MAPGVPLTRDAAMADYIRSSLAKAVATDLIIECHSGTQFHVHNLIVSRCDFFNSACNKGFKESFSGEMQMPDEEEHVVRSVIQHLYGHAYTHNMDPKTTAKDHVMVYAAAEKYQLPDLKQDARAAFQKSIHRSKDRLPLDFSDLTALVYTTTLAEDRGLRDIMLRMAQRHKKKLTKSPFVETMGRLLDECHDFAYELFVGQLSGMEVHSGSSSTDLQCNKCLARVEEAHASDGSLCPDCIPDGDVGIFRLAHKLQAD